jgi:hypothetical protein
VGALPRSRVVDGAGGVEVWRPNGSRRRSGEAEADVQVEVEGVRKTIKQQVARSLYHAIGRIVGVFFITH